jgi:hypothetical protein
MPFQDPLLLFMLVCLVVLLAGNVGIFAMATPSKGPTIDPIVIQGGLTIILLVAGLYVILSKQYEPSDKHWAFGTIGTLVGYWFPRKR